MCKKNRSICRVCTICGFSGYWGSGLGREPLQKMRKTTVHKTSKKNSIRKANILPEKTDYKENKCAK